MYSARALTQLINFTFITHQDDALKPENAVRKLDGETPYAIHPTWCAMTILQEPNLPDNLRLNGAHALLFHDILEDTSADLPADTPEPVRSLVEEMTFDSMAQEMELVWGRSIECQLLKLYDKVSNHLAHPTQWSPEKIRRYKNYTLRLADAVEQNFGDLNIIKMARAIAA